MKRLISLLMCFCIAITAVGTVNAFASDDYALVLEKALGFIQSNAPHPTVGMSKGDWAAFALARSGVMDEGWYYTYYINVKKYVSSNASAVISQTKSSDNSRVIIGLSAIGRSPEDVGGYNLVEPLADFDYVINQGVNGASYTLIALNCSGAEIPPCADGAVQTTKEGLIQYILDNALPNGGWSIYGVYADVDMTAMALQALAPYYSEKDEIKSTVDKALDALSAIQSDNGGFASLGVQTSESCAQVLSAMAVLGISVDDERFVKSGNTVLDALYDYFDETSGGFRHLPASNVSQMSTEQAAYALNAYFRFENGLNSLFDMSDAVTLGIRNVTIKINDGSSELLSEQIDISQIGNGDVVASDILGFIKDSGIIDITFSSFVESVNDTAADDENRWNCYIDGEMTDSLTAYVFTGDESLELKYEPAADSDADSETDIPSDSETDRDTSDGENTSLLVTFRLIGATLADGDVDLGNGDYKGSEYVTWIPTTEYEMSNEATIYDLIIAALDSAGMVYSGSMNGYVEEMTAPDVCGGYKISEFSNGRFSGWMYSINGVHISTGINEKKLEYGDSIVLHYVNDYRYEIKDWKDKEGNTSLGDGKFHNRWLKSDDISPEEKYGVDDYEEVLDLETETDTEIESDTDAEYKETKVVTVQNDEEEAQKDTVKFTDVAQNAWYYQAVKYVFENKLMTGTAENLFEPDMIMTRAMLVTVIYRMAGSPSYNSESEFLDVGEGDWYADAVCWASENGIVYGYDDGCFGADDPVARQDLAVVLYRFITLKSYIDAFVDLSRFSDCYEIEPYAEDGIEWAVGAAIIKGVSETRLEPRAFATRAQIAEIMMRLNK